MSTIATEPRQVTGDRVAGGRVAAAASGIADALSDTADVAWRNLLTQLRTPQALVFATIQPVIFVLLFRYAFGGAIHVPGTNYVDFLMPGIFAQTVAFGAVGTAVGLSGDLRTGILVRFRTLPMARIAVLGGRTFADLARNLLVVTVMIGVGFAAGFRSPHGAGALLAALGLVIAFGYAISWGFASLGLRVSDPEAAQAAAVPVLFLLVFTSAAFVPSTAMPGWLQAFGTHQPVDALVNAEPSSPPAPTPAWAANREEPSMAVELKGRHVLRRPVLPPARPGLCQRERPPRHIFPRP
jgi:ABC-2 type transport system permease protein